MIIEVYDEMKKYFRKEIAFKLALRAKRGISDTSEPGGCTKDHLYLKGYYEIRSFIENGGSYSDLYIGKTGLSHINKLHKIPE
ncbi:MAG: tyrosine/phenylalanine carboxypeptidase domain-containing protein, partial [Bacteroidota bacterium]